MNRRVFIQRLLCALGMFTPARHAVADTPDTLCSLKKFTFSRVLMGTDVSIHLYCSSQDQALETTEKMFARAETLSCILSRHNVHSALSYLNDNKKILHAPPELRAAIHHSLMFKKMTAGAFDVRLLPVIRLLESQGSFQDIEYVFNQLSLERHDDILVHDGMIAFSNSNTSITLDGIAKGMIVDRMIDMAREENVRHCLVNAGGDLVALGGLPGNTAWEISVYNPLTQRLEANTFPLRSGAAATSGIYFKTYPVHGFHHIVNPHQQSSPRHHASVTVLAENATTADAIATACIVLDSDRAKALISALGVHGFFINALNNS